MINIYETNKGLYQIHITETDFRTIDRLLSLDQAIKYIAAMTQAYKLNIAPMSKDTYVSMTYKRVALNFTKCYR